MKRTLCIAICVLALACTLALSRECSAEARCPWLNAATAAGVLGGQVQMSVSTPVDPGTTKGVGAASYSDQVRSDRFDVSCDFSHKSASSVFSLSIVVKTMSDSHKDFGSYLAQCSGTTANDHQSGNGPGVSE